MSVDPWGDGDGNGDVNEEDSVLGGDSGGEREKARLVTVKTKPIVQSKSVTIKSIVESSNTGVTKSGEGSARSSTSSISVPVKKGSSKKTSILLPPSTVKGKISTRSVEDWEGLSVSSGDMSSHATMSTMSTDVFQITDIEMAMVDLAEVYGVGVDNNNNNGGTAGSQSQRDSSRRMALTPRGLASISTNSNAGGIGGGMLGGMSNKEDRTAKRFVDYVLEYRSRQRVRVKAKNFQVNTITATYPPLKNDITVPLATWAKECHLYTPSKPQTSKFLKEHKSTSSVNVSGMLLDEKDNEYTGVQINEMIQELEIPPAYFALPLDRLHADEIKPIVIMHQPHFAPPSLSPQKTIRSNRIDLDKIHEKFVCKRVRDAAAAEEKAALNNL